jgi:multimeric flavodoxin WrbA
MEKIKILGISGSPRRGGNTELAVKEALDSARELPDVETEFYSFAGKKINFCTGCWRCSGEKATVEDPCPRWGPKDAIVQLVKKMLDFDGFIVGSPIYIGTVTAQLKAFFDIAVMITECGKLGPVALRNKVVGAIVTSWDRNAGHDVVIMDIWRWAILHDMLVVGTGPERWENNNYWGACLLQHWTIDHPDGGRGIWWEKACSREELTAVKYDKMGLLNARRIGKRVTEMARVIKSGFEALPREATCWPRGKAGGLFIPGGQEAK